MVKKIRCWDNQLKRYLTLEDYQNYHAIEVETDGTLILSPRYRFANSMMICTEAFIPEYSTGLLDYNKNEVFEGDIVQDVSVGDEYGIIEFEDGHFYIHTPGVLEDIENIYAYEVMGNIHSESWKEIVDNIEGWKP